MYAKLSTAMAVACLLCNTFFISAQSSYDKLIEKHEFDKIHKKLTKKLEKEPDDVMNNFDCSVFYNTKENPQFNTDSAYFFIKNTHKLFKKLEAKEIEKLAKKEFNDEVISSQLIKVCRTAFGVANEKHTIEAYNCFIKKYPDHHFSVDSATNLRNAIAFSNAEKENTVKSFQLFINNYPMSKEFEQAKQKRNALAFSATMEKNTFEAYDTFIQKYKDANEVAEAIKLRDTRAFENAKKENTAKAFTNFLLMFPKSHLHEEAVFQFDSLNYMENTRRGDPASHLAFLKETKKSKLLSQIQDSLFYLSKQQGDFYGLKYCVEKIKNKEHLDSAWMYYYKAYTKDGYPSSYAKFRDEYEHDFPYTKILDEEQETSRMLFEIFDENGLKAGKTNEINEYLKNAYGKDAVFLVLQKRISKYIKAKNWRGALNVAKKHEKYFGKSHKWFNSLIEILSSSDKAIRPKPINSINTYKGSEYAPVISADDKLLYFCATDRPDNFAKEDIFVSRNVNGYWKKPKLSKDFSSESNDSPKSVSADGNEMLLFKSSDVYYSNKTPEGWTEPKAFPYPINTDEWESDIMRTSDGKALIFASQRKGGHNYTSSSADIYICEKTETGWGEPINLGPVINTKRIDRSPFLHPDMKTLYFSSSGHGGLGGLDVFKSTRLSDTCWTEWSKPVNMGKEINSEEEDWGYKISTDGETAYYSAMNSNGANDIYTLNIPIHLRPNFVATIAGNLIDKDNKPIEATIRWEDLETDKIVGESKSSPEDGSYFIVLPLGRHYGYYVDKEDYFPVSNNIDLREVKQAVEVNEDIEMPTFKQMKEDDLAVPVNNLFFRSGSSYLLKASFPELNRVANIIKRYTISVEIAGHTDSIGTAEHNLELSEKRAESVKKYLVMKKVDPSLIKTVGYGYNKPVATNETKEGRAKNRRVELRFVD